MTAAIVTRPTATCTQGVSRYPIGIALDTPTIRWYAEVIMPDCNVDHTGQLVDAALPIIVGDIEYTPGFGIDPGTRDLAYSLACGIALPLGFTVGKVWPEAGWESKI